MPVDRFSPPVTSVESLSVMLPVPELIITSPVVVPPSVRVWELVVASVPSPVR